MSSKTTSGKAAPALTKKFGTALLNSLSIVSVEDATAIAKRDAAKVATDPAKYVALNAPTYYIAINTWLFQVDDVTQRGRFDLLEAIEKKGLLEVIAECDAAASSIIADYCGRNVHQYPGYITYLLGGARNDKEALQLLRYLKRFSPDGADRILKESIDKVFAINDHCRSVNCSGYEPHVTIKSNHVSYTPSRYWIDRVRSRLGDMLAGYCVDWTRGFFSTGVAADSGRPLAAKLNAYALWSPALFQDPSYPLATAVSLRTNPSTGSSKAGWTAKMVAVPKSYKTARVIAEEHAYRQFNMQAIRLEIERCLERNGYKDYLDLHSQIRNQDYANLGSRNGCYATIDLSSASDSIARSLAYEVLPSALVRDVDRFLPRYMSDGKRTRIMHMFCTSGSAVTFPVESVIFLALAMEVRDVVAAVTGEFYLPPCVFGDDIVVDTMLFDTMTDVLQTLGFTVNESKSFGPGTAYRESCGDEYICGFDLKSAYWPRATFKWSKAGVVTAIAQLCSMQHKLYTTYRCKVFLTAVVRALEPRMTSHAVGTECVDLWEDIPVYLQAIAPAKIDEEHPRDHFRALEAARRERHLTLKVGSSGADNVLFESSGLDAQTLVEMWQFVTFLRNGPHYDDELLRLLGVSTKPTSYKKLMLDDEQYWGYTVE